MPVFFKDFERDVDGFFKKHYIGANKGQFRLESNHKPVDGRIYLNNVFEGDVFSVNMHYDSQLHGVNSKLSLFSNGMAGTSLLWKYALGAFQNAIEFKESFDLHNLCSWKADLSQRSAADVVAIESKHSVSSKATAKSEVGLSFAVPNVQGLTVGCGTDFDSISSFDSPVKYGALYKLFSKSIVSFVADQRGDYSLGLFANASDFYAVPYDFSGVVQMAKRSKQILVNLGLTTTCPFSGSALRLKTDLSGKYGLSVSRALPDNTKFNLGFEGDVQSGFKFPAERLSISLVTE